VALSWCLLDERDEYSARVLEALEASEAVVAYHWGLEVANGLLVAERRGRIKAGEAQLIARLLMALPIAVDPIARSRPLDSVRQIGRTHALSAYDAAYLELAVRHGIPLATLDADLRAAAAKEGVELLEAGEPRQARHSDP
jgi:predicted nucleic acid-binding protein